MTTRTLIPPALVLFLLVGSSAVLLGAEPELITDRPDATESAHTVPRGLLQLEAGIRAGDLDRSKGLRFLSAPESLLRIGLNDAFELRLGFDGYLVEQTSSSGGGEETERGIGAPSLGFKVAISEEQGALPQVAFLGTLRLPTGDEQFRPSRADPAFRFALSNTLSERLSLGYNLGLAWITLADEFGVEDTESLFDWTVALGISAAERLGFFVEFYGLVGASASTKPLNVFQGGATYLLTPRLQIDATASVGLSEVAPDWTVGTGISFRFPRFKD